MERECVGEYAVVRTYIHCSPESFGDYIHCSALWSPSAMIAQ